MMKRASLLMVGLLIASAFGFMACDDEDTQLEANEQFCDATAELIASLRVIEDLDRESTVEEVQDARERARTAYANMLESAGDVVEVQLNELQEAYDALIAAVDDIDDESTIAEALESVDDEVANVAVEASKVLNSVDCGGRGTTSTSSDE